jgi:hypothetical protein
LVVKCLIQHAPDDILPAHLRPYRVVTPGHPIMGRLLVPSESAMAEYTLPALKEWCPTGLLFGGSFKKAWDGAHNILRFIDGCGQLGLYTYRQDPQTMVGAKLDYAAYDEPPPEPVRDETLPRCGTARASRCTP